LGNIHYHLLLKMKKLLKLLILPLIFKILSPISKALDRFLKYIFSTGVIRSSKKINTIVVPIENLLRGGENGIRAYKYAEITNDFLRPSTPISDGPHVELLRLYNDIGDKIIEKEIFIETPYYKNALTSMSLCGSQFYSNPSYIVKVAKRFIRQYNGEDLSKLPRQPGQSAPDIPIIVRSIKESSYYEVIDGNHRIARAYMQGKKHVKVTLIDDDEVYTPLQRLLLDVMWTDKRKWLYQPVHAPELKENWTLIRKSTDRLDKINSFLKEKRLLPPVSKSYLDVGSSYGWFVSKMDQAGFESYGLEKDYIAISLGIQIYGLKQRQIINSNLELFLKGTSDTFDVVSLLSVLHHFARSQDSINPEEIIKMIDKVTKKVLFFETGQSHEKAFGEELSKWTDDYIMDWLKENTTFKHIINLGKDNDCIPPFEDYYNRTLFACVR
jgi:2-polyprenyl-3-methyl-5-hydroxy-6-metoxy-1,4-benzoquinol methylase